MKLFTMKKILIFVVTSTAFTLYLAFQLFRSSEPEQSHFVAKKTDRRKIFELGSEEHDEEVAKDFFEHLREPKTFSNKTHFVFRPLNNDSRAGIHQRTTDNRSREQIMR